MRVIAFLYKHFLITVGSFYLIVFFDKIFALYNRDTNKYLKNDE